MKEAFSQLYLPTKKISSEEFVRIVDVTVLTDNIDQQLEALKDQSEDNWIKVIENQKLQ